MFICLAVSTNSLPLVLQMSSKSSRSRPQKSKPRPCRVRVTIPADPPLAQIQSELSDLRQRLDALGSSPASPRPTTSLPPVAQVAPTFPSPPSAPLPPVCDELLATRDSDSESDEGESSVARASRRLRRPTISMAGSLAAAPIFNPSPPDVVVPVANSVDPRLKLHIRQGLYVPIEVLLASEQGKPVNHYLKNPFLSPVNDPKLKVYFPALNVERWTDGFLLFIHIWTSDHPEEFLPLLHYMHIIRNLTRNVPGSAWLNYDREFRILRQSFRHLPWNAIHPQLYFQQIAKVSAFGFSKATNDRPISDQNGKAGGDGQPRAGHDSRFFRRGYCTHFNIHGTCRCIPRCAALAHRCSLCDGAHGSAQCHRNAQPQGPQPTPTAAIPPLMSEPVHQRPVGGTPRT